MIQIQSSNTNAYTKRSAKRVNKYKLIFRQGYYPWLKEHTFKIAFCTDSSLKNTNAGFVDNIEDIEFRLDEDDWEDIQNIDKKFKLDKDNMYPYYKENNKNLGILEYLFGYSSTEYIYSFKNDDKYDLRRENVCCFPKFNNYILEKYNVVNYIPGHHKTIGQHAFKMKNPLWKITENEKEYLLMHCETDTICKLCPTSYQKILDFEQQNNNGNKLTFFKNGTGYILAHWKNTGIYIHQIITGCYGNGKGTKNISVDHIDQDKLNNTWDNLRIATRTEQEQNSKGIKPGTKKDRKHNAKPLPEGITQNMLSKYVYYADEQYGNDKKRDFFRICHPKLDKEICSTKSMKVSIQEKLVQANKVATDLDNDIYPEKIEHTLPKYVSLIVARNKPHLIFEKRHEDKRLNVKMVLPDEYDLHHQLCILNDKIKEKYVGETIL